MMPQTFSPSIVLIGAGNVGYHLGLQFKKQNLKVEQIYSRKLSKAKRLARLTGASFVDNLDEVQPKATVYILAVADDAIPAVAKRLSATIDKNALVVHTSGATPNKILQKHFSNSGVFYPLQSFSISKNVDFNKIPFCIGSSRNKNRFFLEKLAKCIGSRAFFVNDVQRRAIHVAAVFVNNFANHLFQAGFQILEAENISFDLLKPLIEETAAKIQNKPPEEVQTGPAIRGDLNTINSHLEYLEAWPQYRELYEKMSVLINPKLKLDTKL